VVSWHSNVRIAICLGIDMHLSIRSRKSHSDVIKEPRSCQSRYLLQAMETIASRRNCKD